MIFATTKQRILQYLNFKGDSVKVFYQKTEIRRGFLDKDKLKGSVSDVFLTKIFAKYPDINPMWAITGKGEMLLSNNTETKSKSVMDNYNSELFDTQKMLISMQKEEIVRLRKEVVRLEKIEKESEILKANKMFLPPKLDASIPKQAKLKKLEKDT